MPSSIPNLVQVSKTTVTLHFNLCRSHSRASRAPVYLCCRNGPYPSASDMLWYCVGPSQKPVQVPPSTVCTIRKPRCAIISQSLALRFIFMTATESQVILPRTPFSVESFHVPAYFIALSTALEAYTFSTRSQDQSFHPYTPNTSNPSPQLAFLESRSRSVIPGLTASSVSGSYTQLRMSIRYYYIIPSIPCLQPLSNLYLPGSLFDPLPYSGPHVTMQFAVSESPSHLVELTITDGPCRP